MKSNDNNSSVIITNIDAESTRGLIVDWNRHHPMEVVSEGDHITAVNNVECSPSTVRKLQKEFANKQRLQLKIRKDVTYAKAPKVESHPRLPVMQGKPSGMQAAPSTPRELLIGTTPTAPLLTTRSIRIGLVIFGAAIFCCAF